MARRVTLHPSSHAFDNHPGETLLDSALANGLPVDYGCSDGRCGKCRARRIDGEVTRRKHSDFVFPAAETAAGWFLLCCHGAASDLVLHADIAGDSADIERQEIDVKVREVRALDEHYLLVHVQTPRTRRLRFLAGQSARLTRGDMTCELPIASCPCDDRHLHFHLPLNREPDRGGWLASARRGDTLRLDGPSGRFVLDADSRRPRLMIGAGDGMAPLKSIIEHSLALAPQIPVSLLLIEPQPARHYMHNLMRSWRDALDAFTYTRSTADTLADELRRLVGRAGGGAEGSDFYVCGRRELVEAVDELLCDWSRARVHRLSL